MDKISKLTAWVIFSCAVISYGAENDIKAITAIMDAYEKQIDSIKFKYSLETPVSDKEGNRTFVRGTFALKKSEGYVFLDKRRKYDKTWDNDKDPMGNIRSYNGEITRYLEHEKNAHGYHMAALTREHVPKVYETQENPYYNIWRSNYTQNRFSEKLNDPNSMAKIQGEELVDGLKTIYINFIGADGILDYHLWLLPDKNYLPIKFIVYNKKYKDGTQPLVVTQWSEFKEFPGGIWYPMIIKKYFRHLREPAIFKIEEMDISPLTKEDFEFKFPAMSHVTDHIAGTSYLTAPLDYKSLKEKPLPVLKDLGIMVSPDDLDNKRLLICFFDIQQRSSRHCCIQLAKQNEKLQQKGLSVITVQASKVDPKYLAEWVKKHNIPFPVGIIQGDKEKTRIAWGVKSLPWLILSDCTRKVVAEGFTLQEMNDKLRTD